MGKITITGTENIDAINKYQKIIQQSGEDRGTVNIIEPSELGESLKELNDDKLDPGSKMSGIDMRSRLHFSEVSGILAIDTLVNFNFLPERVLNLTKQKKRLVVSLAGKGRQEIVDIVGGKRNNDAKKGGFLQRVFGGDSNKQAQ
jgi:hypothetical protein